MDFFHENRVFHADFLEQNIGMNVALQLPHGKKQPLGLRDPLSTHYAFYDFENSEIYPLETPLEEIFETKYAGFRLRGLSEPKGPYKPFPLDVLRLGLVLERRTRVRSLFTAVKNLTQNRPCSISNISSRNLLRQYYVGRKQAVHRSSIIGRI
jgi:hypothetical protein